jgi:ABC-type uncharacterized transport system fused permease/ATPase subunit
MKKSTSVASSTELLDRLSSFFSELDRVDELLDILEKKEEEDEKNKTTQRR